ncbi:MAG TPA: hypothetical protein PKM43_22425, partial [Verrucomicrobiota bacterium]|nr:hypothetical protein [Verrucomicrobiota bacterium]
ARRIDPTKPAVWRGQTRFDDPAATWDFIRRLEAATPADSVKANDVLLTAESTDGRQHVEYVGSLEGGYPASSLKSVAESLQTLSGPGSLRLAAGSLSFSTGQGLLDWLRANNQPVDMDKVVQN